MLSWHLFYIFTILAIYIMMVYLGFGISKHCGISKDLEKTPVFLLQNFLCLEDGWSWLIQELVFSYFDFHRISDRSQRIEQHRGFPVTGVDTPSVTPSQVRISSTATGYHHQQMDIIIITYHRQQQDQFMIDSIYAPSPSKPCPACSVSPWRYHCFCKQIWRW